MEEHLFNQYIVVVISEILESITCRRVRFSRGPKDTFDGLARGKSPCEDDISTSLVEEGRTGVHVESEAVLKCEGNNKEPACDMLCYM